MRTKAPWILLGLMLTIGCGAKKTNSTSSGTGGSTAPKQQSVEGKIEIDGSSTVHPISVAMAKSFKTNNPKVSINVGISGSGGGFKKFYAGETDISNASRPIKQSEADKCKENNIDFIELKVGLDGLAVIINKENTWAKQLTVEQLKKIWHPDEDGFKNAKMWSDLNPKWPKEKIKLYGPGIDSGTFDYFTEEINGKTGKTRKDYSPSEDDNEILTGVIGDKYALGYLGLAYYEGQKDNLTAVAIGEKPEGPFVLPTAKNVLEGTYTPLSRPLFIYVKKASLETKPQVRAFVQFQLRRSDLVEAAKYVKLSKIEQAKQQKKLEDVLENIK